MHKPLAACLNATRAVFSVRGPDAAAFLQGYVTVNLLTHRQTGAYGALLNAQGRVLGDVFVYPEVDAGGGEPEYLIDCDFSLMDRLAKHLNMFKLRSKVKIAPAKDLYDVWALWSPDEAPPGPGPGGALGEAPQREEPVVWVQDTRGPCPGARLLLPCSRGLTGGDAQEVWWGLWTCGGEGCQGRSAGRRTFHPQFCVIFCANTDTYHGLWDFGSLSFIIFVILCVYFFC